MLNGAKRFISTGFLGELFVVVAKTDPDAKPAHKGVSLILVEADAPGFVRGRRLDKLGLESQDCCELFFVEIGRTSVDRLVAAHAAGEDVVAEVSMAKWGVAELQKRLTSRCLQLHGGYGFMKEYRIAGDYADAAVQTIHGGTSEIMKVIPAKRLGRGS